MPARAEVAEAKDAGPNRKRVEMTRFAMPRTVRQTVTAVHIVSSVGLLGVAGAVGVLAAAGQAHAVPTLVHTLAIPLALLGLLTGVLLGLGTRWGLFRHGWVSAKLVALVGVLVIGVVGVRPAVDGLRAGDAGALTTVIVLNATQLAALLVATVLSVTKPRTLFRSRHLATRDPTATTSPSTRRAAPPPTTTQQEVR